MLKIIKEENASPVIKSDGEMLSTSVNGDEMISASPMIKFTQEKNTSPISINEKESDDEMISASLNIEINEENVSPVIKSDNEIVSTSINDDEMISTTLNREIN